MTIHEASQQLRFQLFHIYDEREAGNITDLVMEHITGWKKIDRVINKAVPLSAAQRQTLQKYTTDLLQHRPLQYVLGEAWFYGMRLYVNEAVLIPRPETEELADWVIKDNAAAGHSQQLPMPKLLDIGTGGGCLPLAIKKNRPQFEVHAIDISAPALELAKKNAVTQVLDIHFHQLDILQPSNWTALPVFDMVVSNPPYIPHADKLAMAPHVLDYEPHLALFVEDNDALIFYRAIADFAKTHLANNGAVYLEIHEAMAVALKDLYTRQGFTAIELRKDLQGRDRMMKICKSTQ
jgi:release factor glutamine methyltransferase